MKKTGMGLVAILAAVMLAAGVGLAQPEGNGSHHPQKEQGGEQKDGGGMMGGMKGGSMKGAGMMKGMMGAGGMMGMEGCRMMDVESRMEEHFAFCLRNAEKLGLSDQQLAELKTIHNEQRKKLIRIRAEIQVLDVDLASELGRPVPDPSAVESILRKQEPLRTDYFLEGVMMRVKAGKVLTEEQSRMLREMHEKMMGGGGMK